MSAEVPVKVHNAQASRRGQFITLEGGEGAGKSTQIAHILAYLDAAGLDAIATREPGGTPHAEALRSILLRGEAESLGPAAEALLFSAARIDHLDKLILPALAARTWVVCDRFSDSTRAYQGALGKLDPGFIRALEAATLSGLRPDLTLILDVDPKLGLARAAARRNPSAAADRFEAERMTFHRGLRAAFRHIAIAEPGRCVLINAGQNESEVARDIRAAIDARLFSARMRIKAHQVTSERSAAKLETPQDIGKGKLDKSP